MIYQDGICVCSNHFVALFGFIDVTLKMIYANTLFMRCKQTNHQSMTSHAALQIGSFTL